MNEKTKKAYLDKKEFKLTDDKKKKMEAAMEEAFG